MDTKTITKLQEIAQIRNERGHFMEFYYLLKRFGLWARMGAGVPKYHCPLYRQSGLEKDENGMILTPVTDAEADILNIVIASLMLSNRLSFAVFRAVFVYATRIDDIKDSKFFKRQFRKAKIPLDDDAVNDLLELFIEKIRVSLLALDTKERNKKGVQYDA